MDAISATRTTTAKRNGLAIPTNGPDIDWTTKARLHVYLASDAGKTFVHEQNVAQVYNLIEGITSAQERHLLQGNVGGGSGKDLRGDRQGL